ncbi:MAG: tetratricopeptide repeat protein, partial [Prochlorothrix sp.]|nr:tetratricopeptide repeat protein [Prochlorothrix sp.]
MNRFWPMAIGLTVTGASLGLEQLFPAPALGQTLSPTTITGILTSESAVLEDGSYYEIYRFEGQAGEKLRIDLLSEEFDAYLMLLDPKGNKIGENDDGGEGNNARLVLELPETGEYQAIVNTYGKGTGTYVFSRQAATESDFLLAESDRLNREALALDREGRYSEAEPLYKRSLSIREEQLGADHPDTAQSLNNLAALYQSQGRYSEAEPLYKRSLLIREQQLGADHPDTATSLNNLAGLYESQGRYSEAEPLYTRSLAITEQQLGADHPDTATSLNNLAVFNWAQDRFDEGLGFLARGLEVQETNILANIATLTESQQRDYLSTVEASEDLIVSLHLQHLPS